MAAQRSGFSWRFSSFFQFGRRAGKVESMPVPNVAEPEKIAQEIPKPEILKPTVVGDVPVKARWKRVSAQELGISSSAISPPIIKVLNELKRNKYQVYLVGGCVRDLVLKRTPKDFDIITTATLLEVWKTFRSHSHIVGKRFPICHVHVDGSIVEVSSFSTIPYKYKQKLENYGRYVDPRPVDPNRDDVLRWRNCLQRDFTINGLMFDPYEMLIYDYMGGLEDIKKHKVRTVIQSSISFQEDCARILRAIRIAARLGFGLTKETARCVNTLSNSVLLLTKDRILMEMNYMLAYGSAEASLRLLWRLGLLDFLLPLQAAYLVRQGFRRRDEGSNMLLTLFANMDKLLAVDTPCHSSLWVGILAFHVALSQQPRNPLVVSAFCLAVFNGGDVLEALSIARSINRPYDDTFEELLEQYCMDTNEWVAEIIDFAASIKCSLSKMRDGNYVYQAMAQYPNAPHSSLVFIHMPLYLRTLGIFECLKVGIAKGSVSKQGSEIDYEQLAAGNIQELRHVFARIVFDTVYPLRLLHLQTS